MKITLANPEAKIDIEECHLNFFARMIADKVYQHKQSLSPEALAEWERKAEELRMAGTGA